MTSNEKINISTINEFLPYNNLIAADFIEFFYFLHVLLLLIALFHVLYVMII